MYTETLKKLGFDDKEIAVFITVLERGRVAPAVVANITGINRSTVYSVAKSLMERGVLHIDTASEPAYLVVESGDVLENLISKQEIRLNEERKLVTEAKQLLENLPKSKNYSVPKIRFYNERELKSAMYERLPIWSENAVTTGEPSWWGFQDASFTEVFSEWLKDHYKLAPEEIQTHMFTNKKPSEQQIHKQIKDSRRNIKYLDGKKHEFTTTHAVLGDYIVYVMTNEKPYYMIEIHDRVMAHNTREMFKILWESLS